MILAFNSNQSAGARSLGIQEEQAPTLGAEMKPPAVLAGCLTPGESQSRKVYGVGGVYKTLEAREQGGQDQTAVFTEGPLPFDTTQITSPLNYSSPHPGDPCHPLAATAHPPAIAPDTPGVVRRLIPLECERLQGYPDNWTLLEPIQAMTDEDYFFWCATLQEKALREGTARENAEGALEVWRYVTPKMKAFDPTHEVDEGGGYWENTHKPYKHKGREQMVAWYNKSFCEDTDSARYRAMGNSIALPSWGWVLARLSLCAGAGATMASLFDGVGGFPLIWEWLNGPGSCLWASEIELFPIAVTRARFKDKATQGAE